MKRKNNYYYSAIKMKVNSTSIYSILNETNLDSPSIKSIVRFIFAKILIKKQFL